MTAIFSAIDMSAVATAVTAIGVLIIGVAMVFKGITLGKRAVNKA